MMNYIANYTAMYTPYLVHYGIKNQKWGVRRWQFLNGRLTPEGRIHYGYGEARKALGAFADSSRKSASRLMDSARNKRIDLLDMANRKGMLDFLDATKDKPFSAISEGIGEGGRFKSRSDTDAFKALQNMDRYLDMARKGREKNYDRSTSDSIKSVLGSNKERELRRKDKEAFSTFLDAYSKRDRERGYSSFIEALKKRDDGFIDKKVRALSKDASDIDSQAKAKGFIDSLLDKHGKADISKLASRWYKTDENGVGPKFKGKRDITERQTVQVPNWVEKVTPATYVNKPDRYYQFPWMKEQGITGYHGTTKSGQFKDDHKFYPFNDEGYLDMPHIVRVPEKRETVQEGWKDKEIDAWKGYTPEYLKFVESLDMPKDYSHLIKR